MLKRRLLFFSVSLIIFGLLFISASSATEATHTLGDSLYFIKKQFLWFGLGIISFYCFSLLGFKTISRFRLVFYFGSIGLLLLLFIPHLSNITLGAKRWLDLGFFGIQPSEIVKLSMLIYFSSLFSQENKRNIKLLILYLFPPLLLIILEPNLSTAVLICSTIVSIYYLSGGEIISLFWLSFFGFLIGGLLIFTSPYRRARLDPNNYHSRQMIIAISSGHIFGKGFANSDQKYRYIPKISTDSILAVIGEETGFVGIVGIISLYLGLIITIIHIGMTATNSSEYLFCQGVAIWISFQTLINMSAVSSLIPLTGVPLPLISYGGSSLIVLMTALGLVYSVNGKTTQNHLSHRSPSHSRHRINSSTPNR